MRLAAIINAWSDTKELLPFCINNIAPCVEGVIVVWSEYSNHFNHDDSISELVFSNLPCQWFKAEPVKGLAPMENETNKRNYGLKIAKDQKFTHFIMMDADEFYRQDDFLKEKERMKKDESINGLVCRLKVHIKEPTLCCDDHTLVPFIHKLFHNIQVGSFKHYPFAKDEDGNMHIDPTRRINCFDRIKMSDIYMHHLSYVRKDIEMKINNSSANLRRSKETIYRELSNAKPGYKSELYHKPLELCENYFNISI